MLNLRLFIILSLLSSSPFSQAQDANDSDFRAVCNSDLQKTDPKDGYRPRLFQIGVDGQKNAGILVSASGGVDNLASAKVEIQFPFQVFACVWSYNGVDNYETKPLPDDSRDKPRIEGAEPFKFIFNNYNRKKDINDEPGPPDEPGKPDQLKEYELKRSLAKVDQPTIETLTVRLTSLLTKAEMLKLQKDGRVFKHFEIRVKDRDSVGGTRVDLRIFKDGNNINAEVSNDYARLPYRMLKGSR